MKALVLILAIFSSTLFANYAYTGQNSGKIDMHGGKGDKLTGSVGFRGNASLFGDKKSQDVPKKEEKLNNSQKKESKTYKSK